MATESPARVRYVCTDKDPARLRSPISEHHVAQERRRSYSLGGKMINRSNSLLDRLSIKKHKKMNNLSHRLCCAPMMDRNDSSSISNGCEAACAQRVHEGTAIVFARVRGNAILPCKVASKNAAREALDLAGEFLRRRRSLSDMLCLSDHHHSHGETT